MTPLYVLNLGAGHPPRTFDHSADAIHALEVEIASAHPFARLYAIVPPGALGPTSRFQEYERGSWVDVDRTTLPIKILELDRPQAGTA